MIHNHYIRSDRTRTCVSGGQSAMPLPLGYTSIFQFRKTRTSVGTFDSSPNNSNIPSEEVDRQEAV